MSDFLARMWRSSASMASARRACVTGLLRHFTWLFSKYGQAFSARVAIVSRSAALDTGSPRSAGWGVVGWHEDRGGLGDVPHRCVSRSPDPEHARNPTGVG